MNIGKSLMVCGAMVAVAASTAQTFAQNNQHETDFNIKFGGVSVGIVVFGVDVDQNKYTFTGKGKTKGLAEWFSAGNATIKSQGKLSGNDIIAGTHYISVTEGKKTETLDMKFQGDKKPVVKTSANKKIRDITKRPEKFAQFTPDMMIGIVDPASTMIVPVSLDQAKDPEAVCGRTFRVFDGETRFDMQLSYKSTQPIKTEGYSGNAYVCKLKYIPVAGHKFDHKNTQRMAANNDMEIWLAPISAGDDSQSIFTAIRINVPTWLGTFVAEPEYFGPKR